MMQDNKKKKLLTYIFSGFIVFAVLLSLFILEFKGMAISNLIRGGFGSGEDVPVNTGDQDYPNAGTNQPSDLDDGKDDINEEVPGITKGTPYSEKLVEDGSINILLIGENKVEGLFDTISILSVDRKNNKIKVIMIPRDMYVEYSDDVLSFLEKKGISDVPGIYKINTAHNIGSMMKYEGKFKSNGQVSFLAGIIKEKFGINIDEFVKVDTNAFAQIVDLFGGVRINVPYLMNYNDPVQNLHIYLEKGEQLLNGKQAEGFVRFRQGYDENGNLVNYGDVERKKNQIAFIKAFIEQHGTISNIDKIPELLKLLGKNVQHSIGLGDVLFKYMGIAKNFIQDKYEIEGVTLSGELKWIDGSQYMVLN